MPNTMAPSTKTDDGRTTTPSGTLPPEMAKILAGVLSARSEGGKQAVPLVVRLSSNLGKRATLHFDAEGGIHGTRAVGGPDGSTFWSRPSTRSI